MKTKWSLIIAVSLIFGSCNGQQKQTKDNIQAGAKNTPKEDIKVNKEYDKNGNLIRFDSTYSYYYSNIEGNPKAGDSIYQDFRKMFYNNYSFSQKPYFNNLFFQDSLLEYDFYKDDFFTQRYKRNMGLAEKMFQQMDSVKNKFYGRQFQKNKK